VKEFFDQLNQIVNPGRIDIIEKDYHLHRLLYQISHDDYLKDALVFKGGTCLVKAYMGYYRKVQIKQGKPVPNSLISSLIV